MIVWQVLMQSLSIIGLTRHKGKYNAIVVIQLCNTHIYIYVLYIYIYYLYIIYIIYIIYIYCDITQVTRTPHHNFTLAMLFLITLFTVIAWQASFQSMDASAAAALSGQTTVMLKNVPLHFGFRTCAQISMCFSELGNPKNYGSSYGLLF